MSLHAQDQLSSTSMLGVQVQHSVSTKFADSYETPTAKRLKRHESTDSSLARRNVSDDEGAEAPSPKIFPREIPDSEVESEEDTLSPEAARETDLESALPPVRTDKEAIAEYEATRAAEPGRLDLKERLGQRKWLQGKSSIYVDAFNLALETVLEDEVHLFNEAETSLFEQWRSLSYEGQYLWL